ncbi:MAG: glycosyltransferase family 1 protein [Betaproteobacteria bacterium HGW-Betaproteobacteria-2]|nr:MAG: glycosyltransferase family 1 protein [Betaproteobacteria bacterium HGW-Betaproteobacteria-2]
MRVLYLYPARAFGGAAKSLIEMSEILRGFGVEATVICPLGRAAECFKRAGLEAHEVPLGLMQFDNTLYGHYRGLRWLILLREFCLLPFSLLALLKLKYSGQKFELVHANEANVLLLGMFAKWLFKVPLVVHVRSVQRNDDGIRTRFLLRCLRRHADAVICIDQTVRRSLPAELDCIVIHNGLNLSGQNQSSLNAVRPKVTLGYVGNLLRLKGVYELLEAVRILSAEQHLDFKLLIYGENVRTTNQVKACVLKLLGFGADVEREIKDFVVKYQLQVVVELRGFVEDVRDIYPEMDILCFTSHLNAAGRPVFEAACFGIPSVVAMDTPPEDAIQHDVTGLVIERPEPQLIAEALARLISDEILRQRLGENARAWSQQYFDISRNAEKVYRLYESLMIRRNAVE